MKKYYKRQIDLELESWATSNDRKPLLLRGARQVGKTSAVRHLGDRFKYFAQIDFNERHDVHYLFEGSYSPQEICQILSVLLRTPIMAGETLLFFDEIQACPSAINRLRYFYEKFPELHLIAAGSLL
ncbi:MAG: AAA family ATPase, partial [Bacteroidales bacterium]|nr:AAA family ATPase [Bacteroidales bacterium]